MAEAAGMLMKPYRQFASQSSPAFLHRSASTENGFSMIEMLIVIAVAFIMTSIAYVSLQSGLRQSHNSQAYNLVLAQIRSARQMAITKREQYIVCFGVGSAPTGAPTPYGAPAAQSIQIFEWPAGNALSSAIQVSNVQLPEDIQFQAIAGFPATSPDGFGNTAINFDQGVAGAITNQIMFLPDGTAHDTNGNYNNGIIYMARNGDLDSARAVTLFGASGQVEGWRLYDTGGTWKWTLQ
jgi:prepilin-type N-terminal cleavage/methylation domain-containing protein